MSRPRNDRDAVGRRCGSVGRRGSTKIDHRTAAGRLCWRTEDTAMLARSLAGLGLVAALAVHPRAAAAQGRPWTLTDALQVESIDDVQIAPDGSVALIAVSRGD